MSEALAEARDTLVIDNIGSLITNDPELGQGPLGIVEHASLIITNGVVEAIGPAGAIADERIDAQGGCVLPGFVDSHTHLVFAGDRAEEFTARMAGHPYDGGGIRVTTEATRNTSTGELHRLVQLRLAEAHRAGTTTIEIKSGYGLNIVDEARSLEVAETYTSESTFLGAHLLPAEYEGRSDDYIDLVCGDMLAAAAPHATWVDAFCEVGAFDADQCRAGARCRKAARAARTTTRESTRPRSGRAAGRRMWMCVGRSLHISVRRRHRSARRKRHRCTFLPAADFSTRQPYPDARRVIDAGATVAIASNCNPGSSYTTNIPFCIALAVRDMHMSIDEAVQAATVGGAAALQRTDVGRLSPGSAGHATILDAPTHHHLAYRPGVPLIRQTIGPLGSGR